MAFCGSHGTIIGYIQEIDRAGAGTLVPRHRLSTRLWHWVNAVTIFVMLMSGLMLFNAHPHLYWGKYGANADPAWLSIGSAGTRGFVDIGTARITTTGVLGLWTDPDGRVQRRSSTTSCRSSPT